MSSFSGIGLVPLKSVASLKLVISVCVTGCRDQFRFWNRNRTPNNQERTGVQQDI
jgi:hypothetical protein